MYFVIIITDAQAIFAFQSLDAASERFHSELAYAMNQHLPCTCIVLDKHGAVYRSEEYNPQ